MNDPDLLDTLRALEAELHHPGRPCTPARLDALLHPGFHEVGRSGRAYDRATVVRHLASAPAPRPVVPSGHAVTLLADGLALMTFRTEERAPDGSVCLPTLRSSVWQRTAAGWQLRYHQGTPAADGA